MSTSRAVSGNDSRETESMLTAVCGCLSGQAGRIRSSLSPLLCLSLNSAARRTRVTPQSVTRHCTIHTILDIRHLGLERDTVTQRKLLERRRESCI